MKRRFRSRRILPIDFPAKPQEPPDIVWDNGMITLQGETLAKIQEIAEADGLTVEEWWNKWFTNLMNKAKEDPNYLQALLDRAIRNRRFAL